MFFIKPEARKHQNEILGIIEQGGLKIVEQHDVVMTETIISRLYGHVPPKFFERVRLQMSGKTCLFGIVEGKRATQRLVEIIGENNYGGECPEGTVRFLFGDRRSNLGHLNAIHRPKTKKEAVEHMRLFVQYGLRRKRK